TLAGGTGLHLLHRTNAYLVVAAVVGALVASRRHPGVARPLRIAVALAFAQVALGVANVLSGLHVAVTALHTAAAASLALAIAAAVRETRLRPVGGDGPRRRVVVVGAGFGGLAAGGPLPPHPAEGQVLHA